MSTTEIVAIVIAVIALAVAVLAFLQTQRTKRLRTRFGPEYDYVVDREGDRRRAEAELSVGHARVMGNYREAHHIAERSRHGEASTEELRRAMICYRELFEDLLGSTVKHQPEEVRR